MGGAESKELQELELQRMKRQEKRLREAEAERDGNKKDELIIIARLRRENELLREKQQLMALAAQRPAPPPPLRHLPTPKQELEKQQHQQKQPATSSASSISSPALAAQQVGASFSIKQQQQQPASEQNAVIVGDDDDDDNEDSIVISVDMVEDTTPPPKFSSSAAAAAATATAATTTSSSAPSLKTGEATLANEVRANVINSVRQSYGVPLLDKKPASSSSSSSSGTAAPVKMLAASSSSSNTTVFESKNQQQQPFVPPTVDVPLHTRTPIFVGYNVADDDSNYYLSPVSKYVIGSMMVDAPAAKATAASTTGNASQSKVTLYSATVEPYNSPAGPAAASPLPAARPDAVETKNNNTMSVNLSVSTTPSFFSQELEASAAKLLGVSALSFARPPAAMSRSGDVNSSSTMGASSTTARTDSRLKQQQQQQQEQSTVVTLGEAVAAVQKENSTLEYKKNTTGVKRNFQQQQPAQGEDVADVAVKAGFETLRKMQEAQEEEHHHQLLLLHSIVPREEEKKDDDYDARTRRLKEEEAEFRKKIAEIEAQIKQAEAETTAVAAEAERAGKGAEEESRAALAAAAIAEKIEEQLKLDPAVSLFDRSRTGNSSSATAKRAESFFVGYPADSSVIATRTTKPPQLFKPAASVAPAFGKPPIAPAAVSVAGPATSTTLPLSVDTKPKVLASARQQLGDELLNTNSGAAQKSRSNSPAPLAPFSVDLNNISSITPAKKPSDAAQEVEISVMMSPDSGVENNHYEQQQRQLADESASRQEVQVLASMAAQLGKRKVKGEAPQQQQQQQPQPQSQGKPVVQTQKQQPVHPQQANNLSSSSSSSLLHRDKIKERYVSHELHQRSQYFDVEAQVTQQLAAIYLSKTAAKNNDKKEEEEKNQDVARSGNGARIWRDGAATSFLQDLEEEIAMHAAVAHSGADVSDIDFIVRPVHPSLSSSSSNSNNRSKNDPLAISTWGASPMEQRAATAATIAAAVELKMQQEAADRRAAAVAAVEAKQRQQTSASSINASGGAAASTSSSFSAGQARKPGVITYGAPSSSWTIATNGSSSIPTRFAAAPAAPQSGLAWPSGGTF